MTQELTNPDMATVEEPLHGLLAEYETPEALIRAAHQVRESGFKCWDTFTPFPVHGIDGAMGIKPTILPWLVFGAGATGCTVGLVLQWWTNAVNYPFLISGKPFWSLPANIPVIFELTVLLSAATAVFGMLLLNNLPQPSSPLDLKARFARATDDRFFLLVQAADPKFDEPSTRKLLEETHAVVVDSLLEDRSTSDRLPRGLIYGLAVLAAASVIPFALIARSREIRSDVPRLDLVRDMDFQPKVKAQRAFPLFADGRGDRAPEPGTVALGDIRSDALAFGKADGEFVKTFPPEIALSTETMARGRQRFAIYCAPCHGLAANGDGMVAARAEALAQGTWVPPTNLNQDYVRQQPVGQIFGTITNGIRNMPAYGPQIPIEDRWAIVMYLRAIQRKHAAKILDVSEAERKALE